MSTNLPKDPGNSRKKTKNPKYDPRVWETSFSKKSSIPQAPKPSSDVVEDFPPLISMLPSHNTIVPPPAVDAIPKKDDNHVTVDPNNDGNTTMLKPRPVITGLDAMGRLRDASYPGDSEMEENATPTQLNKNISEPDDKSNELPSSPKVQTPRTYASIFKDAENIKNKGTLRFIAPLVTDLGTRRAIIPDNLIDKQADAWTNTLVGYFIGKRPAFQFVKFHATRLWKRFDLEDVILNDQGYFYLKFKTEQGLNHVFESGPWLFNDIPILLKKWDTDAWFEKPIPTEVAIWVNIYDMHVTLWDYEILSHIASTIGIPIAVDRYTAEMCEKKNGRAAFARVLVQINSNQEIPRFVEAEIKKIVRKLRLEYNWIPPRCSHCKIFGHVFNDCCARPRTDVEKPVDTAPPVLANDDGPIDQGFQHPRRRKRRAKTGFPITSAKPKFQYVPKVIQAGKGKDSAVPNQSSDIVTPNPTASTKSQDSQVGVGTLTLYVETRNPFDILDGLNNEIGSSSITHDGKVRGDSEDEVYEEDNPTARFMEANR